MNLDHAATVVAPQVEFHETWLYFHLVQAASAWRRMEDPQTIDDFEDSRRAREKHLARANHHHRRLVDIVGHAMDPLLSQMALHEGITP